MRAPVANAALVGIQLGEVLAQSAASAFLNLLPESFDLLFELSAFFVIGFANCPAAEASALGQVVERAADFVGIEFGVQGASAEEIGQNFGFGVAAA